MFVHLKRCPGVMEMLNMCQASWPLAANVNVSAANDRVDT